MNTDVERLIAMSKRDWGKVLEPYRRHDNIRGGIELLVTFLPFVALWSASWWVYSEGYVWLSLLLALPTSGFLVRLFMIQHDCSHGSFVTNRTLGDWIGRAISVVTLTPYDYWRRTHAAHHATFGNLDRRGMGDVKTLTVREYSQMTLLERLGYRLYRHPVILFGLGPIYLFVIQYRVPLGLSRNGAMPWISTQGTNIALASFSALLVWIIGLWPFLIVHLPIVILGASAGVWLFYVQHQFPGTYWERKKEWSYVQAALVGSSYYALPGPLQWITANIGIHHVHHLCSGIPSYRLSSVLVEVPDLRDVPRITLSESFATVKLTLWDEESKELVPFRRKYADNGSSRSGRGEA